MNQEKIGKFISECRRERKMTQQDLAEKLGVSDRTIGNWENGRNMPDLSLFKPLCDELGISINDLMSGEKVKEKDYKNKLEENIINTIDYSNSKVENNRNKSFIILIIVSILISVSMLTIFKSDSSFGAICSLIGVIVSSFGVLGITKKLSKLKRVFFTGSYFIIVLLFLLILDYIGVVVSVRPPKFSYVKETVDNMIIYKALFYDVYRINYDTQNEYYIIDTNNEYSKDSVPISPFKRDKSGIDNIIKYKNKYVGNNSNDGNLIGSLPLSDYGYVFAIDSKDLGLTINYHVTDWYINENYYLEKSLIYNTISLFTLIDNLNYIEFNFSGRTYNVTREIVQSCYPNFEDIVLDKKVNKSNFNMYLEDKMNDNSFVNYFFKILFIDKDIERTQKIVVRGSGSENIVKIIDNKDKIDEIVLLLSRATKITGPVNLDGNWWDIYMYGPEDKILNKLLVWGYNGYSCCFGIAGKEYILIGLDGERLSELISSDM